MNAATFQQWREGLDLSATECAHLLGVTRRTIWMWETERSPLPANVAKRLANAELQHKVTLMLNPKEPKTMDANYEAAKRYRKAEKRKLDKAWAEYIAAPDMGNGQRGGEIVARHGNAVDNILAKPLAFDAFEVLMDQRCLEHFGSTGR